MKTKKRPRAKPKDRSSILLEIGLPLFLLLISVAHLYLRPPWPIDETRYLSVAWEMYRDANLLVPHLNGEPYSHKPPLLFWLIHGGWFLFGVNDWWPRMLSSLFAMGNLYLVERIAKALKVETVLRPGILLLGLLLFSFFVPLLMFDQILMTFVLLCYLLIIPSGPKGLLASLIFGIALGLGILTKGPVMLVHVLPFGLLAPFLVGKGSTPLLNYYRHILLGTLLGIAIALAWALPAGLQGGQEYRQEIFYGQSIGRVSSSFAHKRPFWWYLAILPLLLIPYSILPSRWLSLGKWIFSEHGPRFCAIWIISTLICFSFISGKQPQYLLPILCPVSILLAISFKRKAPFSLDSGFLTIFLGLLASLLALAPFLQGYIPEIPDSIRGMSPLYGMILLIIAAFVFALKIVHGYLAPITSLLILLFILLGPWKALSQDFDLRPAAQAIASLQGEGRQVCYVGKYHGEFTYLGRLYEPLRIINTNQIHEILKRDPATAIVLTLKPFQGETGKDKIPPHAQILHRQTYGGKELLIISGEKGK